MNIRHFFALISLGVISAKTYTMDAPQHPSFPHHTSKTQKRINLNSFNQLDKGKEEDDAQGSQENSNIDPYQLDSDIIQELQLVLENAPLRAKLITKHLKNRFFVNDKNYRVAIFWGEPGTGKSTTAQAIAYDMWCSQKWKYRFISSGDLVKKYRNATAKYLKKIFDEIDAENIPNILIIDEMNELLENTESEHHDTSVTSKLLWTFLDRKRGNHNFFCIGTMNRIDKLAKPFKDRYLSKCIQFTPMIDPVIKNNIFRKRVSDEITQLHSEVTNPALTDLLDPIANCSGRNLNDIVGLCKEFGRLHDPESTDLVIRHYHILLAVQEFLRMRIEGKYDQPEESDKEQRERHHQESLTSQHEMHQENQQQQRNYHVAQMRRGFEFEQNNERRHARTEQNNEQRHRDQLDMQEHLFLQGLRAQTFFGTNNISLNLGLNAGGGNGGLGAAAGVNVNNLNLKDYVYNYVLSHQLLALNQEYERMIAERPTNVYQGVRNWLLRRQ